MNYNRNIIGHGYNESVLRVEHRPTRGPHSKEELIEILDSLQRAGVEAWWYSVSGKGSIPLFPSKVLPYKEDVAVDYYPWLVEEAHKRDIVLFSWEYLNTAPLLMEKHPEWRVKYLKGPEIVNAETERHNHFACFNSPYGDLLKDFCVEVVNDVGFDGIWFDGCYLFGPANDGFRWTCCCERCAKKFKDETGGAIPDTIDWSDSNFHDFLAWRYRYFANYWRELADHVRSKNKTALIAFNFFNRNYMGAVSGSPLERHPVDALVAGEGTVKTVNIQMKTLRAVSDIHPPEIWTGLHDGAKLAYPTRPNPDPKSLIFYAQAAATAGGFASFGYGFESPGNLKSSFFGGESTFSSMSKALKPLKGNVGGEPVRMCAVLNSGMTKDFAYAPIDGETQFYEKNKAVVDNLFGMGFLLNALRMPFEIVLDNQLDETLDKYKVLVLPDIQCMSDDAENALYNYVEKGGILLAVGECGVKTPTGSDRNRGVLDNLLGIKRRSQSLDYCVLEPVNSRLGEEFPDCCMISGRARLVEVEDDVKVIANAYYIARTAKVANHDVQTEEGKAVSVRTNSNDESFSAGVAISEKRIGEGRAIFVAPAIGSDYSQNSNRRSREVVERLLENMEKPYDVEAPPNVLVTAWKKDGRLIFHILNQPPTMLSMIGHSLALAPEDIPPTGPILISIPGCFKSVESPYPDLDFGYSLTDEQCLIDIPMLKQHAIVALQM